MNVLVHRRALRRATSALAVTALAVGVSVIGTAPASAAAGTTDRRAFGVSANGLVDIAPTPNCPLETTAGDCDKSALAINEAGVLTTGVLNAETHATTNPLQANSRASADDVNALGGTVTATLIESTCTADANGLTGNTNLVDASVLGTPVAVTPPAPNTVLVDTPLLRITLNQQRVSPNGEQIIVTAVRIQTFDPITGLLDQDIRIASSQCSFHPAAAPPPAGTGFLEICKKADNVNGPVTGNFTFFFDGRSVTIPVGTCTKPIKVPAGNLKVTEQRNGDTRVSNCFTRPSRDLLIRCDRANRYAIVKIRVSDSVARETILTFVNRQPGDFSTKGLLKICKKAGNGVPAGTRFTFTANGRTVNVSAGSCTLAPNFVKGTLVKVHEKDKAGFHVVGINVNPADRQVSKDVGAGNVTVKIGTGTTVVTYTNAPNGA